LIFLSGFDSDFGDLAGALIDGQDL